MLFLETRKIKVEVPDKEGAVYTTQWLWRYVVFVTHSFREYEIELEQKRGRGHLVPYYSNIIIISLLGFAHTV